MHIIKKRDKIISSNNDSSPFIVITPVRNEAGYIQRTIESMTAQTITPYKWIIVNDGSTDDTGKIIDYYMKYFPWIDAVHRKDRGFRKAGGGVVEAFYAGYERIDINDWDFLVKLDGDLSFEEDYFEKCFQHFDKDEKLGIGGGNIHNVVGNKLIPEKSPLFHVRGATKIYRRQCWKMIGGLIQATGWDTLDEVKANQKGWATRTFTELLVKHYRFTGAAAGTWRNLIKNGKANYICGYHPIFMIFKCLKRLFRKPFFYGSIALWHGFISGYFKKTPQVDDKGLIKYLRNQQLRRLTGRSSIWK